MYFNFQKWIVLKLVFFAKSLQSCPTLCDPIDSSLLGSPVPGILQARTLEWVAISFSNAWKGKVKVKSLSRVRLLATPWTAAYQAPLPMGFSRQEYWSGVPLKYKKYVMFAFPIGCSMRKVVKEDAIWSHWTCFINKLLGIQILAFSLTFSNWYDMNWWAKL